MPAMSSLNQGLNEDNFLDSCLRFRDRQAGVGVVYDPDRDRFAYNAYCMDIALVKELFAVEYEDLDEALATVNSEFGTWEVRSFEKKSGCGSCAAKR